MGKLPSFRSVKAEVGGFFKKISKKLGLNNLTKSDIEEFEKRKNSYEEKARKSYDFSEFFKIGASTWKKLELDFKKNEGTGVTIKNGVTQIKGLDSFKPLPMGEGELDKKYFENPKKWLNVNSIKQLVENLNDASKEYEDLTKECKEVAEFYKNLLTLGDNMGKKDYAKTKEAVNGKRLKVKTKFQECRSKYADVGGVYLAGMAACFKGKASEAVLISEINKIMGKQSKGLAE